MERTTLAHTERAVISLSTFLVKRLLYLRTAHSEMGLRERCVVYLGVDQAEEKKPTLIKQGLFVCLDSPLFRFL
jgi:hypothetical protein